MHRFDPIGCAQAHINLCLRVCMRACLRACGTAGKTAGGTRARAAAASGSSPRRSAAGAPAAFAAAAPPAVAVLALSGGPRLRPRSSEPGKDRGARESAVSGGWRGVSMPHLAAPGPNLGFEAQTLTVKLTFIRIYEFQMLCPRLFAVLLRLWAGCQAVGLLRAPLRPRFRLVRIAMRACVCVRARASSHLWPHFRPSSRPASP